MLYRSLMSTAALAAGLALAAADAMAFDQAKYPDWSGAWRRTPTPRVTGQPGFDQTKRLGPAQQAPLTPEAGAIMRGGWRTKPRADKATTRPMSASPPGMPRAMKPTADGVRHHARDHLYPDRHINTHAASSPTAAMARGLSSRRFSGYSIGKWIDQDGDGRYDVLEVETRGCKGPRAFDAERHAAAPRQPRPSSRSASTSTRPTERPARRHHDLDMRSRVPGRSTRIRRNPTQRPVWREEICAEGNPHVEIDGEVYFLSADGQLMPQRKTSRRRTCDISRPQVTDGCRRRRSPWSAPRRGSHHLHVALHPRGEGRH